MRDLVQGVIRYLAFALLAVISAGLLAGPGEPGVDPEFPVNERNISPPIVFGPIHECARVVHVTSFISNAIVKVFANGTEVGKATSPVGEVDVPLSRALVLGDQITARQIVNAVTSGASDPPVPVEAITLPLTTPVVSTEIYACGRAVPVDNLVTGTKVQVSDKTAAGVPVIGTGETAARWFPVATSSLVKDHLTTAVQISCAATSPHQSPVSNPPVKVKASPSTVPPPVVDQDAVIVSGSEVIVLHNLLPGAEIEIKAGNDVISTGFIATASDNWFPLSRPVPPGHPKITAVQKLCTPSLPSAPVIAVDDLTPPVIGSRVCAGSHLVAIDKTVLNANVTLLRHTATNPTPLAIGSAGAILGVLQLKLNASVMLQAGDILTAIQSIVTAGGPVIRSAPSNEVVVGCDGGANVVTHHNDNFRTGAYLAENLLNTTNVQLRGMREKYRAKLDGSVLTQALYVREVAFTAGGANGVFVGTTSNQFYGLDAATGIPKWQKSLVDPDPSRPISHGVDTTPVIDAAANRIYVLYSTGNANKDVNDFKNASVSSAYWLVALDLRSGSELARVRIAASVFASNGTVQTFIAKNQTARPALLLDHGSIYAGFGSEAGSEGQPAYLTQYHGWIMRFRASDLAPQGVFCTSPNLNGRPNRNDRNLKIAGSGVWQGGGGLAADPDGNVYFLTGNGRLDYPNGLFGDSIVKLTPFGNTLVPTPFMPATPGDPDVDTLETSDADLGSGGPLLIPGTNLLIGGGKTGWMYLLDRTAMQFQQRITAATNTYAPASRFDGWDTGPHLHGTPVFWQGTNRLYAWGEKDFLRSFPLNPATSRFDDTAPAAHQGPIRALPMPMPGAMISLSAQGTNSDSGILWAVGSIDNQRFPALLKGQLYAFKAANLQLIWSKQFGTVPHMAPPVIADGHVYVTTYQQELVAYELGPEGGNLNWRPYVPKLEQTRCLACHQQGQVEELQHRHPWNERFINEATIWTLPSRALKLLAPPRDVRRSVVFEGNGTRTFVAVRKSGRLAWSLKQSVADLVELGPDGDPKAEQPVRLRLALGDVWTASDGSRAVGRAVKSVPAPSAADAPWTLYDASSSGDSGVLHGVTHVGAVYTHAGQPPGTLPTKLGQAADVPYVAQYWFYR